MDFGVALLEAKDSIEVESISKQILTESDDPDTISTAMIFVTQKELREELGKKLLTRKEVTAYQLMAAMDKIPSLQEWFWVVFLEMQPSDYIIHTHVGNIAGMGVFVKKEMDIRYPPPVQYPQAER